MLKRTVGKYVILEKIATGGMGDIFKARHPTLNRDVILKRLNISGARSITERFKREAQLMLDFRNDRIVQVYDHFKEGQSFYIAMEYVNGISLSKLISKKRYLPSEIAMILLYEISQALKYAHDKGVIHRDIKPDNVLISKSGVVKLTDFGIAMSKDSADQRLTREMTLGTPAYMSPEQISDCSSVDKRADIYSLGVVLYEMVTGKSPFPGSISPETINAIQKGKYIKPEKINPKISPILVKIIKKSMHHKIKRRYKDLGEIIRILEKRLKVCDDKESTHEIIRSYIYEDKVLDKKSRKQSGNGSGRIKKILAAAVVFISILGVLIGYAYQKGYYHEFYMTDAYGAFQAEVVVNKSNAGFTPRYIKATLSKKTKKKNQPVGDVTLVFLPEKKNDDGSFSYKSRIEYVPAVQYRLHVDIDNTLYVRELNVKCRDLQKKEKGMSSVDSVIINHFPSGPARVDFHFSIINAGTGVDLTDEADVYILFWKKWIMWKDFPEMNGWESFLVSGKQYYFKVAEKMFYEKIVPVSVDMHQTSAFVTIDLVPYPGTLLIKTEGEKMDVLVNNSPTYISGGTEGQVKALDPLGGSYQRIVLAPGVYYITVKNSTMKETQQIEIQSAKYTKVIVGGGKNEPLRFNIL